MRPIDSRGRSYKSVRRQNVITGWTADTVRREGELVDSNGPAPGTPQETTTYFYDLLGRHDYMLLPNGLIEDYTFDAMGRLDLMSHRSPTTTGIVCWVCGCVCGV